MQVKQAKLSHPASLIVQPTLCKAQYAIIAMCCYTELQHDDDRVTSVKPQVSESHSLSTVLSTMPGGHKPTACLMLWLDLVI
jgi:hypothetical protein